MDSKRLTNIKQFLVSQLNHWALYAVAYGFILTIDSIAECGKLQFWEWAAAGIIYYLMYLIRCVAKELWFSVMLHIPVVVLFAMVPINNVAHIVIFAIFGVIYAAFSIRHQLISVSMSDHTISMPIVVALSFLMLGVQHYFEIYENDEVCKYTIICLIVVYFIQYYFEKYLLFMKLNKDSTGVLPARQIFRSGFGLVSIFTCGTAVVLFLSADFYWLSSFLHSISDGILNGIRSLFRMINTEPSVTEDAAETILNPLNELGEEVAPIESVWLTIIKDITYILISLVVLGAIVAFVVEMVKLIKEILLKRTRQEELGVIDTHEKITKEKNNGMVKIESLRGLSPKSKIRRLFKRKIGRERKILIGNAPVEYLNRHTAEEYESILELEGMAAIYDKARYSEEEITDDDVKAMKAIIKK